MSNTCILASHSTSGWGNLIASNPIATLDSGNLADIENFVAEHASRLLIGYLSYDFGCQLRGVALAKPEVFKSPSFKIFAFESWEEYKPNQPGETKIYSQPLEPTISHKRYIESFDKIHEYLEAGDAYQVNLSHRLSGQTDLSGLELFKALSQKSQADFQAYLDCDDFEIISLSPERFIKTDARKIETTPIKGTRPRGETAEEDEAFRRELLDSPKDMAELNMITDLLRNDLGEVCEVGSVKVLQRREINQYPTVWHAHSSIEGVLDSDASPIAALASMSPGGSISGCPKKRVLEIIDELEPERRGVYTGSIFVIRPGGSLDSSIAIRTMLKQGNDVHLSVGGGIVYDSEAEAEYQETLDKAAAFS